MALKQCTTIQQCISEVKSVNPNLAIQKWQIYIDIYGALFETTKIVNNLKFLIRFWLKNYYMPYFEYFTIIKQNKAIYM